MAGRNGVSVIPYGKRFEIGNELYSVEYECGSLYGMREKVKVNVLQAIIWIFLNFTIPSLSNEVTSFRNKDSSFAAAASSFSIDAVASLSLSLSSSLILVDIVIRKSREIR